MKKIFYLFITLLTMLTFSSLKNVTVAHAIRGLDVINNYVIRVKPNDDATLNMNYHIEWEVLNSTSEGPLTYVRIGVPNRFISDLKSPNYNVKEIKYSSEDGAFVEVYFTRNYYAGEKVNIDFSFKQDRIFTLSENKYIEYRFIPGWFDDIKVNNLEVYWDSDGIIYSNSDSTQSETLLWKTSLFYGASINVDVRYNKEHFPNANYKKQYSDSTTPPMEIIKPLIFIALFIGAIVFIIIYSYTREGGGYYANRGFYGRGFRGLHNNWFIYHQGVDSDGKKIDNSPYIQNSSGGGHGGIHGGGGCACACACACAGGGRAGCARKDFYTPTMDKLEKELNKRENKA